MLAVALAATANAQEVVKKEEKVKKRLLFILSHFS